MLILFLLKVPWSVHEIVRFFYWKLSLAPIVEMSRRNFSYVLFLSIRIEIHIVSWTRCILTPVIRISEYLKFYVYFNRNRTGKLLKRLSDYSKKAFYLFCMSYQKASVPYFVASSMFDDVRNSALFKMPDLKVFV